MFRCVLASMLLAIIGLSQSPTAAYPPPPGCPAPPPATFEIIGLKEGDTVDGRNFVICGVCDPNVTFAVDVYIVDGFPRYVGRQEAIVDSGVWLAEFKGLPATNPAEVWAQDSATMKATPHVKFKIK